MALLLNTTPEAVPNWERNGLITVPRLSNGKRVYGEKELEELRVIRSLRSAHYSINAIYVYSDKSSNLAQILSQF